MKYIHSILCAALALTAFTACDGDQAMPPVNLPEALGEGTIGNGNWDTPMSAYQASLGTMPKDELGYEHTEAWVTGYIVGWVNVDISNTNIELGADFTVPANLNTNILIASRADEKDPSLVASVQLPSGAVRDALNLKDHPENLYQQVTIYGEVGRKYCGAYGVRSVSDYKWGDRGVEPDPAMVLPSGARDMWTANLTADVQGFTFDQGTPSTAGFETWKHSTQYGLVATGGKSGSAVETDAMAISPVVDLTNYESPRLMIHWAANYFTNTENLAKMTSTLVREEGAQDWTAVEIPYLAAGNSWNFSYSGYANLDAFAGKKIQIGFRYKSTKSLSGTWEIDKVSVAGIYSKK